MLLCIEDGAFFQIKTQHKGVFKSGWIADENQNRVFVSSSCVVEENLFLVTTSTVLVTSSYSVIGDGAVSYGSFLCCASLY